MKRIYFNLTALLLLTVLYSCKKNAVQTIDQTIDFASVAQIKYYNFSVGTSVPSVNFYANDVKVTGTTSTSGTESATGTTTGGVYPQSGYTTIAGGNYTFKAQIPSTATANANAVVATINTGLSNGKFYTLYTSGLYNTTAKTSDAFVIEDELPAYDNTVAYVRLVNTISNAPLNMDLYLKNTTGTPVVETKVASNVTYKSGSEFVAVPIGTYELYVRYPSAPTTNVISRNGTSVVSLAGGKVYTLATRGDITVTSTTAANRPQIDFTTNR